MKKLFSFLTLLFFTTSVYAIPDIVAVVNNKPITAYDYLERKKMIRAVNNIEDNTAQIDKQISELALKSLIDEAILFDHAKNVKGKVTEQEIDGAIRDIEKKNNMSKGHVIEFLKSKNVNVNSFREQVKSEIIKMNILSQFSRSVNVSPKEVDAIMANDNQREINVEVAAFTSKNEAKEDLYRMRNLRRKIKSCNNLREEVYNRFAIKETYNQNISKFPAQLQAIIKDATIDKASNVIKTDEGFKIIVVCKKNIEYLKDSENELAENFLTNRKMSQKAKEFLANLHKKASIKINM